jgi:hypothetical protein
MRAMGRFAAWLWVVSLAVGCARGAAPVHGGGAGGTTGSGGTGGTAGGGAGTGSPAAGAAGQMDALVTPADAATDVGVSHPETGGGAGTGGAAGGGTDAGSAGAAGPCGPGTIVCEDFETYAAPADLAAAWSTTVSAATLTVDATKASHGTKALHIKAAAGTPVAVIAKQGAPLLPSRATSCTGAS